ARPALPTLESWSRGVGEQDQTPNQKHAAENRSHLTLRNPMCCAIIGAIFPPGGWYDCARTPPIHRGAVRCVVSARVRNMDAARANAAKAPDWLRHLRLLAKHPGHAPLE